MTNEFLAFAPISATPVAVPSDPATAVLDEMMARVGVDGLTAALTDPALLAQVDQHAAAVREALVAAGRDVSADALAGYARSIAFAARRAGSTVPAPGEAPITAAAWREADFHSIRLLAVCAIAEESALL
jgi:hypothetical protein